ncbi:MAG: hypothetical protein AVDCRST_MAG48-915, partial [uncultured Friedmanniella sp.]
GHHHPQRVLLAGGRLRRPRRRLALPQLGRGRLPHPRRRAGLAGRGRPDPPLLRRLAGADRRHHLRHRARPAAPHGAQGPRLADGLGARRPGGGADRRRLPDQHRRGRDRGPRPAGALRRPPAADPRPQRRDAAPAALPRRRPGRSPAL